MVVYAPATQSRDRVGRYLAPGVLAGLVVAIVLVVVTLPGGGGTHRPAVRAAQAAIQHGPPYYSVRPGDTFEVIAGRTGLTVAQLEAFNPTVDPNALQPGERLNLWSQYPKPKPKPPGPQFWTVRPGQSFGYVAAKTRIGIVTLEQLNPGLKPTALQPGDRIKLRR